MSNPIKKLLGQTAVYGLSSIIGRLLNYLLVPLYTGVFADPSDYGVVSELYAWVAFLVVFLTFGMETAFFRFLQDHEDKEKVFRNGFLTVIAINVLFFLSLAWFNQDIADLMLYSEHNEYIILLGVIVCIDAITALPLAKLEGGRKSAEICRNSIRIDRCQYCPQPDPHARFFRSVKTGRGCLVHPFCQSFCFSGETCASCTSIS
jgi:O-antigen/teichoic acid export membrane protein